jgi:hypothetical protein
MAVELREDHTRPDQESSGLPPFELHRESLVVPAVQPRDHLPYFYPPELIFCTGVEFTEGRCSSGRDADSRMTWKGNGLGRMKA